MMPKANLCAEFPLEDCLSKTGEQQRGKQFQLLGARITPDFGLPLGALGNHQLSFPMLIPDLFWENTQGIR